MDSLNCTIHRQIAQLRAEAERIAIQFRIVGLPAEHNAALEYADWLRRSADDLASRHITDTLSGWHGHGAEEAMRHRATYFTYTNDELYLPGCHHV